MNTPQRRPDSASYDRDVFSSAKKGAVESAQFRSPSATTSQKKDNGYIEASTDRARYNETTPVRGNTAK